MRRRISRAQQTKNWCVGFSFPPPAYAGIHPTLYLFGFRADALNSHSPPYLPGFDPRSCLERFDTFSGSSGKVVGFSCRGLRSSETVRGPPGPLGGFRGPLVPSFSRWASGFWGACEASGASRGPPGCLRAPPGCLRAPPGASGRLRGASGGPSGLFFGLDVGFGSGFRVFWPPSTTPCLADPKFQHFPGHLLETAGQWAPRATPRKPRTPPAKNAPGRLDAPGTPPHAAQDAFRTLSRTFSDAPAGPWRASRKPENPGDPSNEASAGL